MDYSTESEFRRVWNALKCKANCSEGVITKKVHATSTEILQLNTSPKILITNPGVGKFINVLSVYYIYNYNTTTYVLGNKNPVISQGDTSSYLSDVVIDSVTSIYSQADLNDTHQTTTFENIPITLYAGTANPTSGNGTLDIYISYKIIHL